MHYWFWDFGVRASHYWNRHKREGRWNLEQGWFLNLLANHQRSAWFERSSLLCGPFHWIYFSEVLSIHYWKHAYMGACQDHHTFWDWILSTEWEESIRETVSISVTVGRIYYDLIFVLAMMFFHDCSCYYTENEQFNHGWYVVGRVSSEKL